MMKYSDFQIGQEFWTATGPWRCTDIGTRTIAAIKLDQDDPALYNGLPYGCLLYTSQIRQALIKRFREIHNSRTALSFRNWTRHRLALHLRSDDRF